MAGAEIKWFGDKIMADIQAAEVAALTAAALMVESQAKLLCPVGQYPAGSGRVGGNLRSSITNEVNVWKLEARVGSNVHYAPYVELGTVKMAAQPFLSSALEACKSSIETLIMAAVKRGG